MVVQEVRITVFFSNSQSMLERVERERRVEGGERKGGMIVSSFSGTEGKFEGKD